MTGREEDRSGMAPDAPDRALWSRCRDAEASADEAARLLDLAGFAEGRLDEDEAERMAAALARDPDGAADVAAAQALAATDPPLALIDRVIDRALPLAAPAAERRVVPFALAARRRRLPQVAQWASLAAAIVLASWLGFSMGNDFSRDYSQTAPGISDDDGYLPDLVDPSTGGLLHDFSEDLQT
jgi:anti-sigma factor RsiW